MRIHHALALGAALAAPLAAQNPRPAVKVDTGLAGPSDPCAVASSGNVSATIWSDDVTGFVYTSASDGRGLTWSTPLRVDSDATGSSKFLDTDSAIEIAGSDVYAIWRDDRAGSALGDIYCAASSDGGLTFGADVLVAKSTAAGVGDVREQRTAVSDDAGGDHIYVAIQTDPTGSANEVLTVTASHDGGASFGSAVVVPQGGGGADVDDMALVADGLTVHIIWNDDRNSPNDLWYQRSIDGGATWLASDVLISNAAGVGVDDVNFGCDLDMSGSTLAACWQDEPGNTGNEDLWVSVSTNGGVSWSTPVQIVDNTNDVDNPQCAVDTNGDIAVVWEDNRNGSDDIFVSSSTNSGASFSADQQLSAAGGGFPTMAARKTDFGMFATGWTGGGFPEDAEGCFSRNSGASWTHVAIDSAAGDADFHETAYGDLYGNVLSVWLDDTSGQNELFAGGYRAQTVTANNFVMGSNANFSLTDWNSDPAFVWVLMSNNPGNFLLGFGDGRNVGLTPAGSLFNLSLKGTPPFLQLMIGGTATTATLNYNKAPGFTFYQTAVSFTLSPITIQELADVTEVIGS